MNCTNRNKDDTILQPNNRMPTLYILAKESSDRLGKDYCKTFQHQRRDRVCPIHEVPAGG